MSKRKINKKSSRKAVTKKIDVDSNSPTVIWPDLQVDSSTYSTSNDPNAFDIHITKKEPAMKLGTKISKGLFNMVPDGIVLKVVLFGIHKLIGRMPDEKKEKLWQKGSDFVVLLASGVAEGAARGMTSELKYEF